MKQVRKNSKITLLLFTALSFILLQGCGKDILSEEKFIKVYTDLVIAQDTIKNTASLKQVKAKIFARNDVSEREYKNTLEYYNKDSEKWEAFFDKAMSYLEKQKSK